MKIAKENMIVLILGIIAVLGLQTGLFAGPIDQPQPNSQLRRTVKTGPVPGRFIIKLSDKASPSAVGQSLASSGQFKRVSNLAVRAELKGAQKWNKYYILTSPDSGLTTVEISEKVGSENIEFVEQDYYVELHDYPADPLFAHQWYLDNTGQDYYGVERYPGYFNDSLVLLNGIPGQDIKISDFYQAPPAETTKVVVAVIDTGVDMLHPDLAGRIWKNPDEIPRNGIDDDHNGYIDDTAGYDVSGDTDDILNTVPDNDPSDYFGHGTHIAGIIAATADQKGIAGIAPWVEIMPVKTLPVATNSIGAAGIMYAVNAGAQVCNISWGTPFKSLILKDAMDFARENGVFIATSAGNSGDTSNSYPPSYDSSFTVAASSSDGYVASFSTYGKQIDLVAPGKDILSLRAIGTDMYGSDNEPGVHIIDGEEGDSLYYLSDGTSMAAPMVAGAAAWLLSHRPNLNLSQLEKALRMGAIDMIDPHNVGDILIGPDTISGWGLLNLKGSFDYLNNGGLHIAWPLRATRHTEDVHVKIASVGAYTGGWELAYTLNGDTTAWSTIASGTTIPTDSIVYTFDNTDMNASIQLRLTDDLGKTAILPFTYVRQNLMTLTTPMAGDSLKYDVSISGTVYGPEYDSLSIYYRNGGPEFHVFTATREYFGTEIVNWNVSGVTPGFYDVVAYCYFGETVIDTVINIKILASYTAGWPRALPGRAALSAVCSDLDHDGIREIIVGTVNGLSVFTSDGQAVDGFPVLPDEDMRCIPAIYDVDRDGEDEIICTNRFGLHVFKSDGSYAPGWPRQCYTGALSMGYPHPTVTSLQANTDSAIVFIGGDGIIRAYEFNGDSYFYSLEGYYGDFDPLSVHTRYYGGNAVSAADLDGDGTREVAVSFAGFMPHSGLGLFEARTGLPAFDMPAPQVVSAAYVHGTVLADFTGDDLPEVLISGLDDAGVSTIWIKTLATEDLPGWPITIPETTDWLSPHPNVADLDLDGTPEIIIAYFGFDIASLYIFRADGTPYVDNPGRPPGEAFHAAVSFGFPTVANMTGNAYPEIIIRAGYLLPNTGPERVFLLDHTGTLLPGWPIATATKQANVFSTPFAPLVDDIDGDSLVELVLIGEGNDVFVWDFPASYDDGQNMGRLFNDNRNSSIYSPPLPVVPATAKGGSR